MSKQKKSRPSDCSTRTAAENGTVCKAAHVTINHDITSTQPGQVVHIADFLGRGREAAVPLRHLAHLTGLNEREVRKRIERERRDKCPIVSDCQRGYWLATTREEIETFCRSMRTRAFEIRRTASLVQMAVLDAEEGGLDG